jgi:hypothetical protein
MFKSSSIEISLPPNRDMKWTNDTAAYLQLGSIRGTFEVPQAKRVGAGELEPPLGLFDASHALRFPNDSRTLRVVSTGERLSFARYLLRDSVGRWTIYELPPEGDRCLSGNINFVERLPQLGEKLFYYPQDLRQDLQTIAFGRPSDESFTRAARSFFVNLDLKTLPAIAKSPYQSQLPIAMDCLLHNLTKEIKAVRNKEPLRSVGVKYWDFAYQRSVCAFAELIESLGKDVPAEHRGEFPRVFDVFANGDLRVQLPIGDFTAQPSSGYFFLFAELALTVIEGIQEKLARFNGDKHFWLQFARGAIAAQRVYVKAYPAQDAKGEINSFSACSWVNPPPRTEADWRTTFEPFANMAYDELAFEYVKQAAAAMPHA